MGKLKIFFLCLFFFGCTKYSEMERNQFGNYFFLSDQMHVKDVFTIPWVVGITTKQVIAKGIVFTLTFPRIKKEDIFTIHEKSFSNSWLIRVRRSSALGSSILGYFYSPFLLPGTHLQTKVRARPIKSMTLQILYSAATLPDELVNASCPPMDHRKYIDEIQLDPKSDKLLTITLTPDNTFTLDEQLEQYSYRTPTLIGGSELVGVYHFELAFFDSANKKIIGDWVEYPETFKIVREAEIPLEECLNYVPPKLQPDYNDYKRFKWKKDPYKEQREGR